MATIVENKRNQDPFPDVVIPTRTVVAKDITSGEKAIKRTRSNHYIVIRDCRDCGIAVYLNQRIHKLAMINCVNVKLQFLDSVAVMTNTVEIVDCHKCEIFFDATSIRTLNLINCSDIEIQCDDDCIATYEDMNVFQFNSKNATQTIVHIIDGTNPNLVVLLPFTTTKSFQLPSPRTPNEVVKSALGIDGVGIDSTFLATLSRTRGDVEAEIALVDQNFQAQEIGEKDWEKLYDDEVKTYEEEEARLRDKAKQVAEMLKASKHAVVFTGAGISTSAKIPDYRGPEGVWTLSKKGAAPDKSYSLSIAFPTYAHYAIAELVRRGYVKYIVSTNMDGLHRRSGIAEDKISEVHGNCFREICESCKKEFLRGFDVLLTRSDRWTHLTGHRCTECNGRLKDTIVHFTEHMLPDVASRAVANARKADLAFVLGTSMNVQPAASYPPKVLRNKNGKFVLVNIQKTPYDDDLHLKVYGKTDEFMAMVMEELGITEIDQTFDLLEELKALGPPPPVDESILAPLRQRKRRAQQEEEEEDEDEDGFLAENGVLIAGAAAALIVAVAAFVFLRSRSPSNTA